MLREVVRRYKVYAVKPEVQLSFVISILIFICSIIFNFYAGVYATNHVSNYVEDIVLSNIPVFDVGGIFIWGGVALIVFVLGLGLSHPKRIPFVLHSLSLFYFIRGFFVSLTHLAPYPTQAPLDLDFGKLFAEQFGGADLFFSAHTGVPFLLALLFWRNTTLRYVFLIWSGVFGVIVLLGHLHYSIDVMSAFFITYSIYHIAMWLFPKDYRLFHSDL